MVNLNRDSAASTKFCYLPARHSPSGSDRYSLMISKRLGEKIAVSPVMYTF